MYREKGFYNSMFYDFSIKQYEAEILVNEIKKIAPKNILIIGTFKGLSSLVVLGETERAKCKIYCIDPFFDTYYAGDGYGEVYHQMITHHDIYRRIITINGFATTPGKEAIELTRDSSMVFNPEKWFMIDTLNAKFDLVFIDGDHSFENALNDFIKSCKLLSLGGTILIHDICDKLWTDELGKLLDFIKKIPTFQLREYRDGINGMAVVKRRL